MFSPEFCTLKRIYIFTVRNEVEKVMFLHLSVILFTGFCLSARWDAPPPPTRHPHPIHQTRHPPPGSRPPPRPGTPHPPQEQTPPDQVPPPSIRLLLRMVRILLECILVTGIFLDLSTLYTHPTPIPNPTDQIWNFSWSTHNNVETSLCTRRLMSPIVSLR